MSALDLPSRRANVANLRANATTDDERWICDEFVRLFDEIEAERRQSDRLAFALTDLADCVERAWPHLANNPLMKNAREALK